MVFLIQVPLNHRTQHLFVFNAIPICQILIISFQRQTRANCCDEQIIALRQHSPKRALAGEYFDFNFVIINSAKFIYISGINIMKMDSLAAFA